MDRTQGKANSTTNGDATAQVQVGSASLAGDVLIPRGRGFRLS